MRNKYIPRMMRKTAFLLFALTLVACEKTEYVTEYVMQNDRDYYLSILRSLDWGSDTVYAIGHKTPDVDAVCSAISYAALMRQVGFACEAYMAGEANSATKFFAEEFGLQLPSILEDATGKKLILTDHNEYAQAVEGAINARILQIIDHHGIGDIQEANLLYSRYMPVGSTCTIVYQSYRELGEEIPDDMARVMLVGILDDTSNLSKDTATPADSLALNTLRQQLNIEQTELDSLYKNMKRATRDYLGMTDTQIFNSDAKDYSIGGYKLRIASLDWYVDEVENLNGRMLAVMPQIMAEEGLDIILAKVDKHILNPEYGIEGAPTADNQHIDDGSWILYYGPISRQIAEQAFGQSEQEGIIYSQEKLSRKTDIVPRITEAINNAK